MANPSLQIGNSNWAIKEDNLLGYSTAGTRFIPQPITMTRASAGTRVNPQGLVETVELLGSEEVTDGNFPTPNTNWITEGGWLISNGVANHNGVASSIYQLSSSIINGKTYKISLTALNVTAGTLFPFVAGTNSLVQITEDGNYSFYVVAGSGSRSIEMYANASFVGSITNVSVKESTKNNLARVDYDGTASSLLVEPQRTNLITYSEDFTQWTYIGTPIVSSDYGISPDGTQNADRVQMETGDRLTFNSSSANVSFSVYAKSNDGLSHTVSMRDGSSNVTYNMVTTNEWQRFDVYLNTTMTNVQFRSFEDDVDILIWGAQTEVGSYPTSYIPTSGSTVTRVADQYEKTGISNLINSEEGVLFVESAALADDGTNRILTLSDNSYNNSLRIQYYTNTNELEMRAVVGGAVQALQRVAISNVLQFNKIAFLYKVNDFQLWVNGSKLRFDTSGTVPPTGTYNTLSFDDGDGNNIFFSKVKQLQVFKTALTESELIALTTI